MNREQKQEGTMSRPNPESMSRVMGVDGGQLRKGITLIELLQDGNKKL
jgi:hypothetical protein